MIIPWFLAGFFLLTTVFLGWLSFRERSERLEVEKSLLKIETEERAVKDQLVSLREYTEKLNQNSESRFENLANKILSENAKKLENDSNKNLSLLLNPLKEKIETFEKKVSETYHSESRERFALKSEIEKMIHAHERMSDETTNLTRALKGDSKTQGNWGEMKLERLLEQSGLRKGEEYIVQAQSMGLKSENGQALRPDVIVQLPDNKHIIIDSKVSLTAYERWVNEEEEGSTRDLHLKDYLLSVKTHIDGLSAKHYQNIQGLNSPDFVMMFCPIEAAFGMALEKSRDLFGYAWEKRIAIVSPTTLHATLRTVASIWKTERQNKNALEIARQGGALYDKFAAFVSDLERIGKTIDDSKTQYDSAMNKLAIGKGNLVSRAEKLKELGIKSQKSVSQNLVESPDSLPL